MSLVVSGVTKTYGKRDATVRALVDVSFDCQLGEVVALVGNNGAGKSTLMSIAAGLLRSDTGRVTVMGDETTAHGGSPTRHLGLAPQEEAVYPLLTTRENLAYFGRLAGLRGPALASRTEQVADQLLLSAFNDRKASELSGGQRRRLHTALAMMHSPEVMLLDEPTVGVDIEARMQLLELTRSLARKGAAILYSTHQMSEVEHVASRAVVLHQGRVVAYGSVSDLIAAHSTHEATLRFEGLAPDRPLDLGGLDLGDIEERARSEVDGGVVIRLDLGSDPRPVTDLVDLVPEHLRGALISVEVHEPSFERCYLNLVHADEVTVPLSSPGTDQPRGEP